MYFNQINLLLLFSEDSVLLLIIKTMIFETVYQKPNRNKYCSQGPLAATNICERKNRERIRGV